MKELNLKAFQLHLMTSELIPPGSRGVVGYSGGADSTALVHLLAELGVDFVAAHLHHGIRAEADDELAQCEAFCDRLEVPFMSGHANVPQIATEHKLGIEEAGREARYSFLRQAALRTEATWIATAHTRTDHIETILFHALRGSGLSGLVGIRPERDELTRPLLPFDREATRAYCRTHNLWFHDDPANTDVRFARSRLRERVMPELNLVHPGFESALERLSELAYEEDRFLDGIAAGTLEQAERPLNGELAFLTSDVEVLLDTKVLQHLPVVLRRRAVRLAFAFLGETLDHDQTQIITEGLVNLELGSITATGGQIVGEWNPDALHIRRLDIASPARFPLEFPGDTDSEAFGWTISVDEVPFTDQPQLRQSLTAVVDRTSVRTPLHLRAIEPGDKLRPLGFHGSRKASDLLSEAHLTEAARRRLPLVADFSGPLWIPGICLDDRAATKPVTENVLVLKFSPLAQ